MSAPTGQYERKQLPGVVKERASYIPKYTKKGNRINKENKQINNKTNRVLICDKLRLEINGNKNNECVLSVVQLMVHELG